MKMYKGFNKDLSCKNFQFEEGKTYTHDKEAKLCISGFHACEYPLDCFRYYTPSKSEYHEVELTKISNEIDPTCSKRCGSRIKIGRKLSIVDMIKSAIKISTNTANFDKLSSLATEYYGGISSVTDNKRISLATGITSISSVTGDCGVSFATGDGGISSMTGNHGSSSATEYRGISSVTGDWGISTVTGIEGISSVTGDRGISTVTDIGGLSSMTGDLGESSVIGDCGISAATGYKCSVYAGSSTSIAISWGICGRAKGVKGSTLVIAEYEENEKAKHSYIDEYRPCYKFVRCHKITITNKKYKEDVWYTVKDGKIIKCEDDDEYI
jgi:hypothetical protein